MSKMVRPVTTTKVAQMKMAVRESQKLSHILQQGYESCDKESVDKVSEMLTHQIAYLRKVVAGFDSKELKEKILMMFVETAIELEKIGEKYLSLMENGLTADLSKLFEKAGLINNRINLAVVKAC
ncbi:MAG: hypothetical protein AAB688_02370 [Patescibacteria group bacterium]